MDDLIAFFETRLAEEEAAAREVIKLTRHYPEGDELGTGCWQVDPADASCLVDTGGVIVIWDNDGRQGLLGYIAGRDPASALAGVAADRRLIEQFRGAVPAKGGNWFGEDNGDYDSGVEAGLLLAVKIRASRFRDVPGYLAEWAP